MFSRSIGSYGSGNGQLSGPYGVSLDLAGNLFVTDSGNNRIEKFNSSGNYLTQFGNAQFHQPDGIGIDPAGNVFAVDVFHNRVLKFNGSGAFLGSLGTGGSENGQLSNPSGLAIDSFGNIFVADAGNNRVEEFSNSGVYVNQFTHGLSYPEGLAVGSTGNVYVADTYNNRVVQFTHGGTYVSELDGLGNPFAQVFPIGVAADPFGNVYVAEADSGNGFLNQVEKYSPSMSLVAQIGTYGSGNGQLAYPYGLLVDPAGNLFVADANNNRVAIYSPVPELPAVITAAIGAIVLGIRSAVRKSAA